MKWSLVKITVCMACIRESDSSEWALGSRPCAVAYPISAWSILCCLLQIYVLHAARGGASTILACVDLSSYRNSPAKLAPVVVSLCRPSDFGSLISTCSPASSTQVLLFLLGDRFLKADTWRRRSFTAIPAHSPAWASFFSACCIMTRSKATYPS